MKTRSLIIIIFLFLTASLSAENILINKIKQTTKSNVENYATALFDAQQLFEKAKKSNNQEELNFASLAIARIYLETGRYKDVIELLEFNLHRHPNSLTDLFSLNLIIYSYLALNETTKSNAYLEQLDKLRKEQSLYENLTQQEIQYISFLTEFCYDYNTALRLLLLNRTLEAAPYIALTKSLAKHSDQALSKALVLKLDAVTHLNNGETDKALAAIDSLIVISEKGIYPFYAANAKRWKAMLLSNHNRNKEASEIMMQYLALSDSLRISNFQHQITRFNAKYKADISSFSNKRLQTKRKVLNWILITVALIFIILVCQYFSEQYFKKKMNLAKQKAENSERLKSMFLANMNHEIRAPLNAIAGFSDLLADETDPEICAQYKDIIKNSNELLVRLLTDVLDISHIEAGTMSFNYTTFNLKPWIVWLYDTLKLRVNEPVVMILDEVPEINMTTDRDRLTQVMTNLITNAIKFTEVGTIRIGYQIKTDSVYFYCLDTGRGIAPENQADIFSRFVQGKEQKGGVGLGLALCKGFVTNLGGEIGVISALMQGSTFWFTLPIHHSKS